MKSRKPRNLFPLLLLSLLAVSACSTPDTGLQTYPPFVEMRAPEKPAPSIDILTSARAEAEHNVRIESWGDGMRLQIIRVCNWAKTRGADIDCQAP